jgi:hypothetical protein
VIVLCKIENIQLKNSRHYDGKKKTQELIYMNVILSLMIVQKLKKKKSKKETKAKTSCVKTS